MTLSPSNTDRTRRAERVLVHYAYLLGCPENLGGSALTATLVSDLLADLMHYAAFWQIEFEKCVDVAKMHFEAEEKEELPCTECPRLAALKRIAGIPLWGERITNPEHGDKHQLAEDGEYDLENDCYEPCCDAESSWLRDAVETARTVLAREGLTIE